MRRGGYVAATGALTACASLIAASSRASQPDAGSLQALVAALGAQPTRPIEGRLSAVERYAPPPLHTPGEPISRVPPQIRVAAAAIEKRVRGDATPQATAALGVAYLAIG